MKSRQVRAGTAVADYEVEVSIRQPAARPTKSSIADERPQRPSWLELAAIAALILVVLLLLLPREDVDYVIGSKAKHVTEPLRPCPWFQEGPGAPHRAIPRILHQTVKNASAMPSLWLYNQATWRINHPVWEYRLWSDAENRQLAAQHFPWFLPTYQSFKNPIMRVDSARYMYMYVHGGVYVDMDVESLKPLDPLLQGHQAVLATMGADLSFSDSIPNAFLASEPGHPFWLHLLKQIQTKAAAWRAGRGGALLKVEEATGPAMLRGALDSFYPNSTRCSDRSRDGHSLHLLQPDTVFPFDWHNMSVPARPYCLVELVSTFHPRRCKAFYPDAYCISYWSHSWRPNIIH